MFRVPQLFTHIAVKGAQTGSVLGAGAAGTSILYNIYKTGQTGPAMDIALTRTGTGFAYGLAAVSVLGAARMMQLDADGIQDRAYRLHYNGPPPFPIIHRMSLVRHICLYLAVGTGHGWWPWGWLLPIDWLRPHLSLTARPLMFPQRHKTGLTSSGWLVALLEAWGVSLCTEAKRSLAELPWAELSEF